MGPSLSSETKVDVNERDATSDRRVVTESPPAAADTTSTPRDSGDVHSSQSGGDSWWGMTPGDRRVVFAFALVALLLMVVHWIRIVGWQPSPLMVERPQSDEYRFVLNVNTATWVEWMQLDGIGETLARRIVTDREEHGPFATIEEVDRVAGVGPKTLVRIRDHLVCPPPSVERPSAER